MNISLAKIALVKRKAETSWQRKLMQMVASEKKAGTENALENYVWHDGSHPVSLLFWIYMLQTYIAICRPLIR